MESDPARRGGLKVLEGNMALFDRMDEEVKGRYLARDRMGDNGTLEVSSHRNDGKLTLLVHRQITPHEAFVTAVNTITRSRYDDSCFGYVAISSSPHRCSRRFGSIVTVDTRCT